MHIMGVWKSRHIVLQALVIQVGLVALSSISFNLRSYGVTIMHIIGVWKSRHIVYNL